MFAADEMLQQQPLDNAGTLGFLQKSGENVGKCNIYGVNVNGESPSDHTQGRRRRRLKASFLRKVKDEGRIISLSPLLWLFIFWYFLDF